MYPICRLLNANESIFADEDVNLSKLVIFNPSRFGQSKTTEDKLIVPILDRLKM